MLLDVQDKTVGEYVRDQIDLALEGCRNHRKCREFPDRDFLFDGIVRVLGAYDSGRHWLQDRREKRGGSLARATAFDALNSSRRQTMTMEAAEVLQKNLSNQLLKMDVDHLASFPELRKWNVLAADGHAVEHAAHAPRDDKGRHVPDVGLYALDLRTGLSAFLRPVKGAGHHAHEWPAFKAAIRELRPAKRTLWVQDRAFIDLAGWQRYRGRGVYQITRLKDGMCPIQEQNVRFDKDDPVNVGVRRCRRVGFRGVRGSFLLVEYRDPETRQLYRFLSTLPETFRPGLVAWLYLLRWKIEKLYDTFKSKLHETKAWANSRAAAVIRPLLISMTYNLLVWLQHYLHSDFGIADDKVARKFRQLLVLREKTARVAGRCLHPLHLATLPHRLAQMSVQFIRCVNNHLFAPDPIYAILPAFRAAQLAYL